MKVKIDTKEKFHVINHEEPVLSANMTEEPNQLLLSYLEKDVKNIVLKMGAVSEIDEAGAENISTLQQTFYDNNCSFCDL